MASFIFEANIPHYKKLLASHPPMLRPVSRSHDD